jgi:hypothetical protein
MTEWSPEREREEDPQRLLKRAVDAMENLGDSAPQAFEALELCNTGRFVYDIVYNELWRQVATMVPIYSKSKPAVQQVSVDEAQRIHEIAKLAAEHYNPPAEPEQ